MIHRQDTPIGNGVYKEERERSAISPLSAERDVSRGRTRSIIASRSPSANQLTLPVALAVLLIICEYNSCMLGRDDVPSTIGSPDRSTGRAYIAQAKHAAASSAK